MDRKIKIVKFLTVLLAGIILIQADSAFACKKCYGNDLYWYNSCGERGALFQDCGEDSVAYQCSGNWLQKQATDRGCASDACFANTSSWANYQNCGEDSYTGNYKCSGNLLQKEKIDKGCSSNSCFSNTVWETYQNCADSGKICQDGACVESCASECLAGEKKCSGTSGYQTCGNYDSDLCLEWSSVKNCASGYSCSEEGANCVLDCVSHSAKKCYNEDLYWYDSCNNKEGLVQDCGEDSWTTNYQCSGNFWIQRQKTNRGCSSGACYANTSWLNYRDCSLEEQICQGGACVESCSDECSSGQKQCSGTSGYKICGNYDSDSCLDWSSVTNCASNQTCSGGNCTNLPVPTVDLKLNGYNGSVSLDCNSAGTLSWESANVTSCVASNGWSGLRSISSTESTGALTYSLSRTYTITCTGPGGSASDSVTANVICWTGGSHSPSVNAGPDKEVCSGGTVLLDAWGFDSQGDTLTYSWSCNGGSLQDASSVDTTYTAPTVSVETNYICTLTATCSSGLSVSDQANVKVKVCGSVLGTSTSALTINKLVRNLSDGKPFADSISAKPNDVVSFYVNITAGNSAVQNVIVKDVIPAGLTMRTNTLKIDGATLNGDMTAGINIGSLSANQSRTITFDADILGSDKFSFGDTQIINSALVYNSDFSQNDTAKITVTKTAVSGATTIPTGLANSALVNSIVLSLVLIGLLAVVFKMHLFKSEEWFDSKVLGYRKFRSDKTLKLKVAQVKLQGLFGKKMA
jgi:uncharacterized repeat protein (TIGR01451 family)